MKSIVVIPARMASTRLPNKPMVNILGKSLLQRTFERCIEAVGKERVFVATDHEQIYQHCEALGANVLMTPLHCLTGTDRVAELAKEIDADYYINVQGDEPLINPRDILDVESASHNFPGEIINGYAAIKSEEHYHSLTTPKVVFRPDGRLLYMSRAGIPGNKHGVFRQSWRQICVYGFPKEALLAFAENKNKTLLEDNEDIEILRFLELGFDVRMIELSDESLAVDTPEDLEKVKQILLSRPNG